MCKSDCACMKKYAERDEPVSMESLILFLEENGCDMECQEEKCTSVPPTENDSA